jgi:hypothetical protein
MHKIILCGATAVVLILANASAYARGGGGDPSPEESPYAILEPQTVAPLAFAPRALKEGRSAFSGNDTDYSSQYSDHFAPLFSPEDRNSYSRGQ